MRWLAPFTIGHFKRDTGTHATGASEQLHFHERAQQVFYILSGTATFEVEGGIKTVKPGQSIHSPPPISNTVSLTMGVQIYISW